MDDGAQARANAVIGALDAAWSRQDVEGAVAFFTADATLESPLVLRLLNRPDGICRGRDDIRHMIEALMRAGLPWGTHAEPLVRGNTVVVEFNTATEGLPYSVDVIELRDGKIQSLRAYTGWRALTQ